MHHLQLDFYRGSEEERALIEAYELNEGDYALHPSITVKERGNLEGNELVMVKVEEELIGFFCLDTVGAKREYGGEAEHLLFRAFSIDRRFRNRQYAKITMLALDHFAKENYPQKSHILLVVNHANIPAQRLYEKCGYIDTKRRCEGLYGEVFVYLKALK